MLQRVSMASMARRHGAGVAAVVLLMTLCIAASGGASLSGVELASALRAGGYVILMRHASSPRDPPDATKADADNPRLERQLDEGGRASARAFGDALRRLAIPLGQVLSSPSYRALETIRLARLGPVTTFAGLGDSGQSMVSDSSGARGAWLRAKTAEAPARGKDTLIVTHLPNIMEAYPQESADLADGEAMIFRPDGRGAAAFVARIRIEQWTRLDGAH